MYTCVSACLCAVVLEATEYARTVNAGESQMQFTRFCCFPAGMIPVVNQTR